MAREFEFGYESDDTYYIRHMTDGTTTLVQIMGRRPGENPVPIATGVARRRKGETRNTELGSALAFARAHAQAAVYYKGLAEVAEKGSDYDQIQRDFLRVITQDRKARAQQTKDERRQAARDRWLKENRTSRWARYLLGKKN